MAITNALAGIAVRDMETSVRWYSRLLDRMPDRTPMPEVAEWEFADGGWIQVFHDKQRAGSSSVTLVESSLEGRLDDLKAKRISVESTSHSPIVNVATVRDMDGNQIVFAESKAESNRSTQSRKQSTLQFLKAS